MVKIVEMFIPKRNTFTRPGMKMVPTSITIHETANKSVGANALVHARLQQRGNSRQASWHIQVDDGPNAYLSIPFNEIAYHSGTRKGNYSSIAIEICVNKDGNFKKAVQNAAKVVRHIMKQYPHIKLTDIKQHYDWNKKNCPRQLRTGSPISWNEFLKMVGSTNILPKKAKPSSKNLSVGTKIVLNQSATHYSTGEKIPNWVKGKTYTVQQIKGNNVLLKEIYSWVKTKDITLKEKKLNRKNMTFKVGQKVKIKRAATKYSRSSIKIPNKYKGKAYTIQQVGKDDLLLKELYSWVKIKDVE